VNEMGSGSALVWARAVVVAIIEHGEAATMSAVLEEAGFRTAVSSASGILSTAATEVEVVIIGASEALKHRTQVCRRLRGEAYAGGVIAIAEDRESGVAMLEAGADDFVVEPPETDELVARIRAAVRRGGTRWRSRWEGVEIDRVRRLAYLRGQPLTLTPREYDLLAVLIEADGEVVSRADLLARVWGCEQDPGSNLVEVHLSRLRDKLGPDAMVIGTVRGSGYRMRK
jgi:DNA-binding response OmpR family regulator